MDEIHFNISHLKQSRDIITDIILPKIKCGFDRQLDVNDFTEIKKSYEVNILKLFEKLSKSENITENVNSKEINECIVLLLIVCGEHSKESLWSSSKSVQLSDKLMKGLLRSVNAKSCTDVFLNENEKIMKLFFNKLRPHLLSSTWKNYPTAVTAYCWALHMIKMPHMEGHLDTLLPTALILSDDFLVENKLIGIQAIAHIIDNVTYAELKRSSHDEVIYKTLEMSYREKDAQLVPLITATLLALLSKMYPIMCPTSKWTHYDDVMTKYLFLMSMEVNNDVKKSYIDCLPNLISSMGLSSVRYIKGILDIIEEYSFFPATVTPVFKVLDVVLEVCWPCIHQHMDRIAFIVLKVIYALDTYGPARSTDIRESCQQVLKKISLCHPTFFINLKESDKYSLLHSEIQTIIENVS